MVKNSLANARDARDGSSVLGSGISPGEGKGNLLVYSCLKNPMDRGDWRATLLGMTEQLSTYARILSPDSQSLMYSPPTLNQGCYE